MDSIDMLAAEPASAYKLLVGAVQPRPIAWVSTISADGVRNLAPFSFFTVASRQPPTILVSIARNGAGAAKDTLENLVRTGEFVVNIPSQRHRAAVELSSREYDAAADEFDLAGLAAAPSRTIRPPRVADVPVALECRLHRTIEIGTDTVVFGTVLWLHAADGIVDERAHLDHDVLQPLGRLAGPWYAGPLTRVAAPLPPVREGVSG